MWPFLSTVESALGRGEVAALLRAPLVDAAAVVTKRGAAACRLANDGGHVDDAQSVAEARHVER
jgi:hypothetical protein